MITNLSHVNNYNGLGRSFFTSNPINKDEILFKLRGHPKRGELLAHLVNFKMYRTSKNNDIEKQDSELTIIEEILNQPNSSITFDEAQHFVRNKSALFQRQLPHHFKQAIINLLNDMDSRQQECFWDSLTFDSSSFLEKNGVAISAFIKVQDRIDSNSNRSTNDSYETSEVVEKFDDQLDHHSLTVTLIKNCSSIDSNGKFRSSSTALRKLEKYGDQLEDNVRHSLVKALIENCSSIDSSGKVRNSYIALYALKKYWDQLEDNVRHSLVKALIENCSSISPNGKVHDSFDALEALEEYGDQLEDNVRHSLVKALIENCSGIDSNSNVRSSSTALQALEEHGNQLEDNVRHSLVKALIKNCSGISPTGQVREASKALKLLNQNKLWLSAGENNRFYRQAVGDLFDSSISSLSEREFTQLLERHGEVISAEAIQNKYRQTDLIRIVQAIRAYVQGGGQYRRINLPPRLDMQVNGRPLAGIAFEVHNFTEGIESAALKAIDEFLTALKVLKPKFTINDLIEKFNLIENEQLRNKANNALNRLLGAENYKEKLELALPIIAAFLNLDHATWETAYRDASIYWNTLPNDEKVNLALKNDYKDPGSYWQNLTNDQKIDLLRELRWSMWLAQSFVEAGSAYDSGTDSTSCVKGVYER
ncbi:MAG: hypothetical protein ACK4M7_03295, partial [Burkholderiales bacterium]